MTPISARAVFVGRQGHGAGGKTIVFGILERHGKVYTEIVPNAAKRPLQAPTRGAAALDSIIHSDGWMRLRWASGQGVQKAFPCESWSA